jgi:diguanylate cyclase (GGDEF)-like protein
MNFVTLPRSGGSVGELLGLFRASPDTPRRTFADRVLVVSPRDDRVSQLLRGLLGGGVGVGSGTSAASASTAGSTSANEFAMAPWFVDGVDLACRWMSSADFDCIILGGPLHDGHSLDCLRRMGDRPCPPAIGVCDADDAQAIASYFRAGCTDVLLSRDLASRRTVYERTRAAISAGRARQSLVTADEQRALAALEREQEKLISDARCDALTGVLNRAAFRDLLDDAHQHSRDDNTAYALLIFDIDHFKSINDRCGHQRGDDVLKLTAHTMADSLRGRGSLARVGGEEFAVICPGSTAHDALAIAEEVRCAVQAASPGDIRLSVSGGVASAPRPGVSSGHDLYALADAALYASKKSGRNRITIAPPPGAHQAAA